MIHHLIFYFFMNYFVYLGFIHLRMQQRLSLCPFGNNLVTLGLHGEQFQKITKNFFFQRFRVTYLFVNELVQCLKWIVMLILFYLIWNCKIGIFLNVYHFITLAYFRENWSRDPRKRMKLRKLLSRKLLIDFQRCLGMPKMKTKGHFGLEIMLGMICYHIGMHLSIVPSVHRQKKMGIWKRVGVCTQVVLLACKITPLAWYVH